MAMPTGENDGQGVESGRDDAPHDEGEQRRPGRPRDPGYDKTILDATLEILFDKGYAGLTIDGVAARTGVGRPTIYRRWSSKPALVIAALTQSVGLSPTPDTGALRDDLLAFQRQQLKMMDRPESRRVTAGWWPIWWATLNWRRATSAITSDRAKCRCGKPSSAASSAANFAPMPTSPSSTTCCSGPFSCARSCAANRSTPSWPHRLSISSWLPSAPQEHVGGVGPLPREVVLIQPDERPPWTVATWHARYPPSRCVLRLD